MKVVRDPIHGYIKLNSLEMEVLDHKEMQRLRRIRQLGFTNLVYPSATHSRFEHSLGTFSLAGDFAESIALGEQEKQEVKLAALLHDIGHTPFSHTNERFLRQGLNKDHEEIAEEKIMSSSLAETIEERGLSSKRISEIIQGGGELGEIVSGKVDVDRMDYIQRDGYYTGVAHGTVGSDTIILNAERKDGKIVFRKKGLTSLESFLVARYLMIPTVYLHHASEIPEAMLRKAVEMEIKNGFASGELKRMSDWELFSYLGNSELEPVKDLIERLRKRDLYKTATKISPEEMTKKQYMELSEKVEKNRTEIAEEITKKTDAEKSEVLVHVLKPSPSQEKNARVISESNMVTLKELSPLVQQVENTIWNHISIDLYAPEEKLEEVRKAGEEVLNSF
ncbi:MAG: HD domain-containing protein [Candidatus Aenigmatarchaeota archaeon]